MRFDNGWKNYRVLATGDGYKLEDFNGIVLLRPDPQVIWRAATDLSNDPRWCARYIRSESGGGRWESRAPVPPSFSVEWEGLRFSLKLMGFKHTGIFPEQAYNWRRMAGDVARAGRPIRVLNLFGYTGGATVALARAGAEVCHVDAAKAMCERAGANVRANGLAEGKVRYIVDDCVKFVEREIRRNNRYDAILMDPPSYGRGPKGELWKLEDKIYDLVALTAKLLSDRPLFYLINSYTTGLQPTVMKNVLERVFATRPHRIDAYELGLPTQEQGIVLPCGASAYMTFEE